jgi:peptidoglycan/LPS O-acetylase OafA/YrhL
VTEKNRFEVLDGWRGISILLVLWGHWFPAGPRESGMNASVASSGMALFFTLSGFLITTFLHKRPDAVYFLIRRTARILPLAWVFSVVMMIATGADLQRWMAHLFFYGNLPPFHLAKGTEHLWSLCVEMHFYFGVAALIAIVGRAALYVLPILCLSVTALRIANGEYMSIVTWFRLDEILAGATLALIHLHWGSRWSWPNGVPIAAALSLAVLLMASANPHTGALNYLRPYFAALLVGVTLFARSGALVWWLKVRPLAYVARVSYAVYVLHGGLTATWLGGGEGLVKYARRPFLIVATFLLAHLSTVSLEARAIEYGRTLSGRLTGRRRT